MKEKNITQNDQRSDGAMPPRLQNIRVQIDAIDAKLLELLNKRAELCREVGHIKSTSKESVFKPFREKEVLSRLADQNPGSLPDSHLRAIYREILSSSRSLQQPQAVVYLGPEGTFSYFAGIEYLGHSANFKPCRNLKEVFQRVASNTAQLGIIPLENSLSGGAGQCLDLFLEYEVYVQAEMFCKISHALLSREPSLASINEVYSHPQAIEQCSDWLRTHLPGATVTPMESTAAAARYIAERSGSAVIGHMKLSKMFGLNVLFNQVEDLPDNWTRFMIIDTSPPQGGGKDKTSLIFTLPDKAGALVQVLNVMAQYGINLKKLESRPLRHEKWNYLFFADLECDVTEDAYARLKDELFKKCSRLKILGSYPIGPYLSEV